MTPDWKHWYRTDHLRVCGADLHAPGIQVVGDGSPPRVRSRPAPRFVPVQPGGITSACAEQTAAP